MNKYNEEKGGLFAFIVIVLAVAVGYFWWQSGAETRERNAKIAALKKAERDAKFQAAYTCRKAIAVTAAYGKDNMPGHREPGYSNGLWQIVWPQGSFYFKNGFGVDVPQSAACFVSESTGEIIYLSVSGREIIK